jgi:hypothetical protein
MGSSGVIGKIVGFLILTAALALPLGIGLGVPSVWDQRHRRPFIQFWLPVIFISGLWLVSICKIFLQP